MTNEKDKQLKIGAVLSYVNLIIGSVIPLFYTPVMLRMLGQAEYGLYSLAQSVVGYLSLLNFGFGNAIIRYIIKYRSEKNKDLVEKVFGFSVMFYSIIGSVVFIGGLILSSKANIIFSNGLTVEEIEKIKILIVLLAVNMAISLPLSVFSSVTIAYEKYIFRKLIDMLSSILSPLLNIVALYMGYKSIGMVVSATILQFLLMPINSLYCFKKLEVRPKFGKLPKGVIKEMMGFSFYVFIATLVDMLFWATDKVILGMRENTVSVAIYNVAATFNNMLVTLATALSGILTPKITGMVFNNASKEELSDVFIKVGRIQSIIIALAVTGFVAFGRQFLALWAGNEYISAYWIALLTIFPLSVPLIQNAGLSILMAKNKHKFRAITYLIIAIINVVSTYVIVPYLGGFGAALCSCISYIVGHGLIMNIYYDRVIKLNIKKFWKNISSILVIPLCMLLIWMALLNRINCITWTSFVINGIVFTLIYSILMYKFVLNNYEKGMILEFKKRLCKRK